MAATIDRQDEVITVREYAARKRITLGTAYRRIWAGQVHAQQFFGRWLIRDLERPTLPAAKTPLPGAQKGRRS